jgi:type IV secretory pathway TrbD component
MNRAILDLILYGAEWAMTVIGGCLAVALFQSNAHQLVPTYRAYRLHRALGEDALAAAREAATVTGTATGALSHSVSEHAWTLADIQRLRPCRRLTTSQCQATVDRLTAADALTWVGKRDGQDLYRLDLRPPADTTSGDTTSDGWGGDGWGGTWGPRGAWSWTT